MYIVSSPVLYCVAGLSCAVQCTSKRRRWIDRLVLVASTIALCRRPGNLILYHTIPKADVNRSQVSSISRFLARFGSTMSSHLISSQYRLPSGLPFTFRLFLISIRFNSVERAASWRFPGAPTTGAPRDPWCCGKRPSVGSAGRLRGRRRLPTGSHHHHSRHCH